MSKPDDIPQGFWNAAEGALIAAWDAHAELFNPLSNSISQGLWDRMTEHTARALITQREECAKWHDVQADALEAAIEEIIRSGGWIDHLRRSQAELHRRSATAIRAGQPGDGS